MKFYNLIEIRKDFIKIMKIDKKNKCKHVRYELMQSMNGEFNCIDPCNFKKHDEGFSSQGFYEYKRETKYLNGFRMDLVVMRNQNENLEFEQIDGLLVDYLKAGCELCYFDVIL